MLRRHSEWTDWMRDVVLALVWAIDAAQRHEDGEDNTDECLAAELAASEIPGSNWLLSSVLMAIHDSANEGNRMAEPGYHLNNAYALFDWPPETDHPAKRDAARLAISKLIDSLDVDDAFKEKFRTFLSEGEP